MYDTGARVPRRLWYPVWETTSLPLPFVAYASHPLNSKFSSLRESEMWNPKIVYRISAENNKHSSLYRPILFIRIVQREDSREKKKKTFFLNFSKFDSLFLVQPCHRGTELDRSKAVFNGFFYSWFLSRGHSIAAASLFNKSFEILVFGDGSGSRDAAGPQVTSTTSPWTQSSAGCYVSSLKNIRAKDMLMNSTSITSCCRKNQSCKFFVWN